MTIFDLLFLALVVASIVTIFTAACYAMSRQRARALRIVRVYLICATIYFGIVIIVSLFVPRRVIRTGDPLCYDNWCITVDSVEPTASSSDVSYVVNLRLSSRARGVTQRENYVAVYITDSYGRRFNAVPQATDVAFNAPL
jgi:hypothetical protein